ncbi:hypothetical protein EUX98_g529 [Antrodiella citrinella]|uniref:C3H1-type domain-containing protein n=1 Tax=Antrodiella citrinella TaxID=2447956 RepID=A0A4S4N3Q4_9APHY|nr:hypothetical protein EUX98_g529 [Antrodiella citrinella]
MVGISSTEMDAKMHEIIQRNVQTLQGDITTYIEDALSERSKKLVELEQDLESVNGYNDYLKRLVTESVREKDGLKAEITRLKEQAAADEQAVLGQAGGRLAAAKLTEFIKNIMPSGYCQIHVYVFAHKLGLIHALKKSGLDTVARHLEDFIIGFNQSTERFIFLDVGSGKEAVDSKLRAYLEDEAKFTQTTRIIFGGYGKKLVLLQGYENMAAGYGPLSLPTMTIPELFEPIKLEEGSLTDRLANISSPAPTMPPGISVDIPKAASPVTISIPASAGPMSYKSVFQASISPKAQTWRSATRSPPRTRRIDPTKVRLQSLQRYMHNHLITVVQQPLSKQEPPPCNIFYLTNGQCKFGDKCAFAHDYLLNSDNIDAMRDLAKKSPCAAVNKGEMSKCYYKQAGTCKFIADLSTLTVNRSSDLESRVSELELELAVWKQAHTNVRDAAEREKKTHNVQVATLNRQISSLQFIKSQHPLILCAIDGNTHVFRPSYFSQGIQGGRMAAQALTKVIAEYLAQEDVQVFGRLSFWITVYLNREGLLTELLGGNVCTAEQFNAFFLGFSQASPRFLIIDVGPASDGVELKIREYLQTYVRFPQTLRMFLGGGRSGDYRSTLNGFGNEELLGKLVLLQGHNEPSADFLQYSIPSIHVEDIFVPQKPYQTGVRPAPGPISLPPPNLNHLTTTGGLISPESETHSTATNPSSQDGIGRLIDPLKPLHKREYLAALGPLCRLKTHAVAPIENPPPCNEHYLMSCSKGAGCKYSHDWLLTPEQLDTLAKNAKKAPCNYLKNGTFPDWTVRTETIAAGVMFALAKPCLDNRKKTTLLPPPLPVRLISIVRVEALSLSVSLQGYKLGAAKTVEEYAKLDAEDESLARWKASLGIVPGSAAAPASGPQVTVFTLELASATLPSGKVLKMNIQDPASLANIKKHPFVIKENIEYNVRISFKVNHGICSGVRYMQVVKRSGVRVDKMEQMLGSYSVHPQGEAYIKNFEPEESPSGMLARTGTYHVRSCVLDDDGHVYADWDWSFKLAKEWE